MTENRDFLAEFEQLRVETDGIREALVSKTAANFHSSEILRELKRIEEKHDKQFAELSKQLESVRAELVKIIPIRHAILGDWKMVEYENFEACKKLYKHWTLEQFAENIKFKMVDGKLKQTGGGYVEVVEGGNRFGGKDLFVEDNYHVKTCLHKNEYIDRYIQNGKLHVVQKSNRDVWKRVY